MLGKMQAGCHRAKAVGANCAKYTAALHLHVVTRSPARNVDEIYTTVPSTQIRGMPERAVDECTLCRREGKQILLGGQGRRGKADENNRISSGILREEGGVFNGFEGAVRMPQ